MKKNKRNKGTSLTEFINEIKQNESSEKKSIVSKSVSKLVQPWLRNTKSQQNHNKTHGYILNINGHQKNNKRVFFRTYQLPLVPSRPSRLEGRASQLPFHWKKCWTSRLLRR